LFPSYTGTFLYDAQTPEASRIELRLAADAMKCVDAWLNSKDLKSVQEYAINDMLVADQYPEIHFTSSEIRRLATSHFEVRGTLTIRGTGRPYTVDVTLQEDSVKSLVFRGAATIRLTDYGLKLPKALLGTIGTKDEMEFAFTLVAEIRPSHRLGSPCWLHTIGFAFAPGSSCMLRPIGLAFAPLILGMIRLSESSEA
jgi:polyisoprenoid-binding protein YceI